MSADQTKGHEISKVLVRERGAIMGFCNHCEGQRFDRAQVLRTLRAAQRELQNPDSNCSAEQAFGLAIQAVRVLEIPHLEPIDDYLNDQQVVH